jgi:hypothetical protein
MDSDEMESREWLIHKHVEEAVMRMHQILFADDLTLAESKLAWMQVIEAMVQSVALERQTDVSKEWWLKGAVHQKPFEPPPADHIQPDPLATHLEGGPRYFQHEGEAGLMKGEDFK